MTSKDESKLSISKRLQDRRELLGIGQKEMAKELDISVKDIERYESNQKSPDITTCDTIETEIKKYLVEIYDPQRSRLESRDLDLFEFKGINLLLEELKNEYDYIIEFCGRIKPGKKFYDKFDKITCEENNILEITNIKKVEKNAKN